MPLNKRYYLNFLTKKQLFFIYCAHLECLLNNSELGPSIRKIIVICDFGSNNPQLLPFPTQQNHHYPFFWVISKAFC